VDEDRSLHLIRGRTRVLDEEWENTFRRLYPDFRPRAQAKKAAWGLGFYSFGEPTA